MLNAGNPIGVMDSGIGGLTVVRELQRILPGEDIIYFGDSANCPYGNKTSDQIFDLSCNMLRFLGDNGVKCTAIACNTISTMADRLRPCFDYQIISTLPSITSASTYLTCYTFADTLSKGITYNKHDVVLEFFTDAACTDPVAKWAETDGKFTVTYSSTDTGESGMTIEMTADGLKEMNTAVYSDASMVNSGYSDCTLRITYAATVNSSADVVYGDNGNPNEVVLTWKRTSQNSYDTLKDDAKVFTYGLELTKLFSDGKGDFSKVQFIMQNKIDGYYVKARLDEATGVYYVTDHVADKKDATRLVPTVKDGKGKILIKGLEDDEYTVTEIKTADGYTLLKKGIAVVISRKDASTSAAVDGKQAAMLADNGSANALVPLSVVNTSGFDLPATGDRGVWMYGLAGMLLMTASAACIIIARKRFK